MATDKKTYRHNVTGLVSELDPGIALVFRDVLTEVEPDAKPLAYLPIPAEAIAEVIADRAPKKSDAKKESEDGLV